MFMHAAASTVDPPSFHFDFMRGLGGEGAMPKIELKICMRSKPKAQSHGQRPKVVADPLGLAAKPIHSCTGLGKRVVPRLRELVPCGQRESEGVIHAT